MSERSAISVSVLGAGATYSLRIAPELVASVREAAGFDLTGNINTAINSGSKIAARLGPDEWLLIGPDGQSNALSDEIGAALAGHFHSLVDVSHRNVGIAVAGREAPMVLNAGVPIDLDDAAFPAGSATRTVLGKAEIVLMRPDADRVYRVECWRSFAPYVRAFLEEAAREFNSQ
jgi:sarcosine oxidase subunit gamma